MQNPFENALTQLRRATKVIDFPDANTSEVASQFAVDILETRPDWTLYDVIYFFKFR
jgi:hypothetical protein